MPFRQAAVGMCLECCVAALFQVDGDNTALPMALTMAVENGFIPNDLLLPHVQEQFRRVLEVGMSQAQYDDIDWVEVIRNWDMPFQKIKGKRKRYGGSHDSRQFPGSP